MAAQLFHGGFGGKIHRPNAGVFIKPWCMTVMTLEDMQRTQAKRKGKALRPTVFLGGLQKSSFWLLQKPYFAVCCGYKILLLSLKNAPVILYQLLF